MYVVSVVPSTGPALADCTPVAVPVVVAVLPDERPPPVIERLNWSVSDWRLTTFFCSCKTGGFEQAPRSTPIVPPLPVKLTGAGPAITAPELGLILSMSVPLLEVEYSRKRLPALSKAMPLYAFEFGLA